MKTTHRQNLHAAALLGAVFFTTTIAAQDPLPSWNGGPAKQAIVEFVAKTTKAGSPDFVPVAERIATFDQDGTLWVEHPMYSQVLYCFHRVSVLAKEKPELKDVEPFKTVISGDREAIERLTMPDLEKILAVTLSGISTEQFQAEVKRWLAEAKDPRWKKPYTELTYQPMQEVLTYLRANGYKTYIWAAARTSCACMPSRPMVSRRNRSSVPWAARNMAMTRTANRS